MRVLTDREGTRKSLWLIDFYSRNGFLSLGDSETKKDLFQHCIASRYTTRDVARTRSPT